MSYLSIHKCVNDWEFMSRLIAACADEGALVPDITAADMKWAVAAADDIEAAYLFALNSGNEHPGGDETVITDGMILAAVQFNWPDDTPPA